MGQPAVTKQGGKCLAAPDTCHLPAPPPPAGPGGIPTPYPNKGDCSSADKTTKKVVFNKKKICVENSKLPRSSGDEAGCSNLPTPKGLMSQKNMGKIRFKSHSSKVKAENKGIVPLLATSAHNGSGNENAPMGKVIQSSCTNIMIN